MLPHIIRINQGRCVPLLVRLLLSAILAFAILKLLDTQPVALAIPLSILLSGFVPFIWSTFYILEINLKEKTVRRYIWLTGIKLSNKMYPTDSSKRILVKKNEAEPSRVLAEEKPLKKRKFKAYLEFSDKKLVFLISANDTDDLLKRLEPIQKKSKLTIESAFTV